MRTSSEPGPQAAAATKHPLRTLGFGGAPSGFPIDITPNCEDVNHPRGTPRTNRDLLINVQPVMIAPVKSGGALELKMLPSSRVAPVKLAPRNRVWSIVKPILTSASVKLHSEQSPLSKSKPIVLIPEKLEPEQSAILMPAKIHRLPLKSHFTKL